MSTAPPVGVLGGGSFGQGLARSASRNGRDVILWSRSGRGPEDERVRVTDQLGDLARAELLFVATPSLHVPNLGRSLGEHLDGSHLLVHVSRGLVGGELRTLTQVLRQETPCRRVGALAGPLVATALADGAPAGAVVGTRFPEVADAVRGALGGRSLRIYQTSDVIGVEVASAMVGLIALVAGYLRGKGMSPASLAVLATRGMAEATRIGVTVGANERTFSGLAGYGDLIAAIAGDERPEMLLGRALAEGKSLEEAGRLAAAYIEGVGIARQAADYAARLGIEAPISDTVGLVLEGRIDEGGAVERLMARHAGSE